MPLAPTPPRAALLLTVLALAPPVVRAQIELEDRRLIGQVGFTNDLARRPGIDLEPRFPVPRILADSVGRPASLANEGVLLEDPALEPGRVRHEVVVQAWGGDYWLRTGQIWLATEPPQSYAFGFAQASVGPPGYPNFNDAWVPFRHAVGPGDPEPVEGVDLLECAGRLRLRFVEEDPDFPGEYRSTREPISASLRVSPRRDLDDSFPPYDFSLSQATVSMAEGDTVAELWVRSSEPEPTRPGPPVPMQLEVHWWQTCTIENPACPREITRVERRSWFGGRPTDGSLGELEGFLPNGREEEPGLHVPCDAEDPVFLYIVVTPCRVVCAPTPSAALEGCAGVIGESEIVSRQVPEGRDRTWVLWSIPGNQVADSGITNSGEASSSPLFEHFEPLESEGRYRLAPLLPNESAKLEVRFALDPRVGSGLPLHRTALELRGADAFSGPPDSELQGPDLCVLPGIFEGTVLYRDANVGGGPTGGLRQLAPEDSTLLAQGERPSIFGHTSWSWRDHRGGLYRPAEGTFRLDYRNYFGALEDVPIVATQRTLVQTFHRLSSDPALYVNGSSLLRFDEDHARAEWRASEFVSPEAGGTWTGPLLPGTEVAPHAARTFPADYEACFAKLRIEVSSLTVPFFEPEISVGQGTHVDDRGTPDPADDIGYGSGIAWRFRGSPRRLEDAANEGVVNLHLPQGSYTGLGGFIKTVLDPDVPRTGSTALPEIDLELGCGQTCSVVADPEDSSPLLTLCVEPLPCNDAGVLAGRPVLRGKLHHEETVVRGAYRINDGPEVELDLEEAGITCVDLPCTDELEIQLEDDEGRLGPCLNTLELSFEDETGARAFAPLEAIIDLEPPVFLDAGDAGPFSCGGLVLACEGEPIPEPVVVDDCSAEGDGAQPLTVVVDRPGMFPPGDSAVSWLAIDACGNEATCEYVVRVGEDGAAELSCPEPLVLPCEGAAGRPRDDPEIAAWLDAATVEVACGALPVIANDAPELFPSGCDEGAVTTVTFTAVDAGGNELTCTSTVTVVDDGEPVLVPPAPLILECSGPEGVPASDPRVLDWLGELVSDGGCGESLLEIDRPESFPSGCAPGSETLVGFTLTDACGRSATAQSTITVVDSRPPTLMVPEPLTLECEGPGGLSVDHETVRAWLASATASDDCGPVTLSHDAPELIPASCPPGTPTLVTFTAVDQCGLEVSASSTLTVVDTQPPVIERQPVLLDGALLWPPQHGYVVLGVGDVGLVARDACGDVEVRFTACASSQPEDNEGDENAADGGDGHSACDCAISPEGDRVALRAERDGGCAPLGRTYTVSMEARDTCGRLVSAEPFRVCVPHDRRDGGGRRPSLSAAPDSHQPDDLCLEGWQGGSHPPASPRGAEPTCGSGCPE